MLAQLFFERTTYSHDALVCSFPSIPRNKTDKADYNSSSTFLQLNKFNSIILSGKYSNNIWIIYEQFELFMNKCQVEWFEIHTFYGNILEKIL